MRNTCALVPTLVLALEGSNNSRGAVRKWPGMSWVVRPSGYVVIIRFLTSGSTRQITPGCALRNLQVNQALELIVVTTNSEDINGPFVKPIYQTISL